MFADPPANGLPAAIAMYAPSRDQDSPATAFALPLIAKVNAAPVGVPPLTGLAQNCNVPESSPRASSVPVGANAAEVTLMLVLVSTVNAETGVIVPPPIWNVAARPVSNPTAAMVWVALDPACSDRLSG